MVRKAKQLWRNANAKASTLTKLMAQLDEMMRDETNPHKLAKVREAVLENLPRGLAEAIKREDDGHRAGKVDAFMADIQADRRWPGIRAKLQITDAELKEVHTTALKLARSRSGGRFDRCPDSAMTNEREIRLGNALVWWMRITSLLAIAVIVTLAILSVPWIRIGGGIIFTAWLLNQALCLYARRRMGDDIDPRPRPRHQM